MEPEFERESLRSSEEDAELVRSIKKFKDDSSNRAFSPPRKQVSYKDSLLGDIPGAYAQAFRFDAIEEVEGESDTELEELVDGMVDVHLSKETKARIRAPWTKALIVKVYGRTLGYNYLSFKINTLWKPVARMDCIDLGRDFFLIKFHDESDYDRMLRGGPWLGHKQENCCYNVKPSEKAKDDDKSSQASSGLQASGTKDRNERWDKDLTPPCPDVTFQFISGSVQGAGAFGLATATSRESGSGSRRGDCANKGCTDGDVGLVRRGSKQGMEALVPDNSNQCKDRQPTSRSSNMGNDAKPLVEVHHRSTSDHREGSRGLEQIKEAFGNAPLGRIRLVNLREEGDRFQGLSNDSLGECSNNEVGSDS
nr:hypothetical protein CFP56_47465 [Quercus suber]